MEQKQTISTKKSGNKKEVLEKEEYVQIKKELCSLKGEMRKFKEFTFKKFDQLTGRNSTESSSTNHFSDDEDFGKIGSKLPEPRQSKQPAKRKLWDANKVFEPYSLRFEGNGPQTIENSPDETGRTIPLIPGSKTYSGAVSSCSEPSETTKETNDVAANNKLMKIASHKLRRQARESKTLIFSSSITRDIKKQTFNSECKKSNVVFHEFRGKRAKDIVRYMTPHLEDENPSNVIIVAGGNDLPDWDIPTEEIKKVATCLIDGGRSCREQYGVANVFISSIMPRSNSQFQGNRHRLNAMLSEMCLENDIIFINNDNIVLRPHGHPDGVHLNEEGSKLLHANLLHVLNH